MKLPQNWKEGTPSLNIESSIVYFIWKVINIHIFFNFLVVAKIGKMVYLQYPWLLAKDIRIASYQRWTSYARYLSTTHTHHMQANKQTVYAKYETSLLIFSN